MLEQLDWTERLTVAVTATFLVTLALTVRVADPIAWVLWGVAMVLLSGGVLVAVNRSDSSA
ncbi:hypothetical protein [Natronorubrum halalkaliphilum]|uniref:hypothetical protein n=1 Tax=Natronorubrum halalkaliphilum TaxID=2691917 RepID=UPI00191544D9|nr:hypothetical protein [Natronorubrum halalkaliphilum]